jgi:hypothetical protein
MVFRNRFEHFILDSVYFWCNVMAMYLGNGCVFSIYYVCMYFGLCRFVEEIHYWWNIFLHAMVKVCVWMY